MRVPNANVPDWYETVIQTCYLHGEPYSEGKIDRWLFFVLTEGFRLMNILRNRIYGDISVIDFVIELFEINEADE